MKLEAMNLPLKSRIADFVLNGNEPVYSVKEICDGLKVTKYASVKDALGALRGEKILQSMSVATPKVISVWGTPKNIQKVQKMLDAQKNNNGK